MGAQAPRLCRVAVLPQGQRAPGSARSRRFGESSELGLEDPRDARDCLLVVQDVLRHLRPVCGLGEMFDRVHGRAYAHGGLGGIDNAVHLDQDGV
eukprot:9126608-Pyramimonas_sp.AAC.1